MRKSQFRSKHGNVQDTLSYILMSRKKKNPVLPSLQETVAWTVCVILFIIMITALKGAYILHAELGRIAFGSSNSSFALLAAGICTSLWGRCFYCCVSKCEEKK